MNAEIVKRWIAALRSGEYTQTRGHLRDTKGFCCLGVLCDVLKDEVKGHWRAAKPGSDWDTRMVFVTPTGDPNETVVDLMYVPYAVAKYANMHSSIGAKSDPHSPEHLAQMNDRANCSFAIIADYIEQIPVEKL